MTLQPILAAAITVITLYAAWRSRREISAMWDRSSTFVLIIGIAFSFSVFIAKISGNAEYKEYIGTGQRSLKLTGWSQSVPDQHAILLALFGLVIITSAGTRKPALSVPHICWALILFCALLVDYFHYGNAPSGEPILLFLGLIAAAYSAETRIGPVVGAATYGATLMSMNGIVALINPKAAIEPCTDKCGLGGHIFAGVMSHGNSLGMALAVCFPFIWLASQGITRRLAVTATFTTIFLSGSRSALIATLLTLIVLAICNPSIRSDGTVSGRKPRTLKVSLSGAVAVSFILPYIVSNPNFATGRARLWQLGLKLASKSPIIGEGSTAWFREYMDGAFGSAAAYSTHNQWVEITLILGFLGIALFSIMIFAWAMNKRTLFLVGPVLFSVFCVGVTERPIAFQLNDLLSWSIFALILISNGDRLMMHGPNNARTLSETKYWKVDGERPEDIFKRRAETNDPSR